MRKNKQQQQKKERTVIASEKPNVLGTTELHGEEEETDFCAETTAVDVISEEQPLTGFVFSSVVSKDGEQVVVLAVEVPYDGDRGVEAENVRLVVKHVARLGEKTHRGVDGETALAAKVISDEPNVNSRLFVVKSRR